MLRLRASIRAESLSQPTGQGSGSSMGNGSQKTSREGTLCGEWICRQILSTAVCVSMNSVTVSPSRPPLDNSCQRNGDAPQHRPSLRNGKLPPKRKSPQKRLQGVSESLRLFVPVVYLPVVVCSPMLNWTYTEWFLGVPVGNVYFYSL